jgi:hypothetical protein
MWSELPLQRLHEQQQQSSSSSCSYSVLPSQ